MQPFLAMITPLADSVPPEGGGAPPHPDAGLPLFPFHPIVVPPGGAWPKPPGGIKPPEGGGEPPHPDIGLPLFPFHPIVVPPGGSWPDVPVVPERERKFGYIWLPESGWTLVSLVPIPAPSK
jgi:hypothetical protein